MAKRTPANPAPRIVNRRARHEYEILEKLEVGLVLQGSEVKSVRQGQVSLGEGYARVDPVTLELYLHDVDIGAYTHAGGGGHEPKRRRKLLAHKRQIHQLLGHSSARGTTLVPLALYFVRGRAKLELGVGRGRRSADKRQAIRQREHAQEMRRAMSRRRN
jgi:SsrA-binding protein